MCALARAGGCAVGLFWLFILGVSQANAEKTAEPDNPHRGRELFERVWQPGPTPALGDGLGPMYNERSCVACHFLGGIGGAGPNMNNVDLLSALPPAAPAAVDSWQQQLPAIHPAFARVTGILLHKYSTSADYPQFRERVLGLSPAPTGPERHAVILDATLARNPSEPIAKIRPAKHEHGVTLVLSQRNTTPMFGAGLIDGIGDFEIKSVADQQKQHNPRVTGRFVGRFGWRGQIERLGTFVRGACAAELGLNVPGSLQSFNPLNQMERSWGFDLTDEECEDLTRYIASLPRPSRLPPVDEKQAHSIEAGQSLFGSIGCAICHQPTMGNVTEIYSDLLVHDMGTRLEDPFISVPPSSVSRLPQQYYGSTTPVKSPQELARLRREWKTPPLWGLRDSGPYLHDGRAATVDDAILWHGGEAAIAVGKYKDLSASERDSVLAFLATLAAPGPAPWAKFAIVKP